MGRLSAFAYRIGGWPWRTVKAFEARRRQQELEEKERQQRQCQHSLTYVTTMRLLDYIERVLLWENVYNSISVAMAFNIMFWGFVVLEVRGLAAASSAALVILLCYSTLETQKGVSNFQTWKTRSELLERLVEDVKLAFEALVNMQQEEPRELCIIVCMISLILWIFVRKMDSVLFTYVSCMAILIGPVFFLRLFCDNLPRKEWDNGIEEFLPAVTEDNLQVLKRAGETGDRSPTPPNSRINTSHDHFDDEDSFGLKIPSHEDGSTDGLELSELELSNSETDIDGIRFQTGYFERDSSSSDDDVDLGLESKKFDENDSDSENSEFEIIDSRELANLKSV